LTATDDLADLRPRDNPAANRFEVEVEELVALIDYRRAGQTLYLIHTEVPDALEGRGVGSMLVRYALEQIAARGEALVPLCPFVAGYLRRHPEYVGLVSDRYKGKESLRRDA
jgi:predicted GNAT family acetyltransferase